jgi:hypothetical protein
MAAVGNFMLAFSLTAPANEPWELGVWHVVFNLIENMELFETFRLIWQI